MARVIGAHVSLAMVVTPFKGAAQGASRQVLTSEDGSALWRGRRGGDTVFLPLPTTLDRAAASDPVLQVQVRTSGGAPRRAGARAVTPAAPRATLPPGPLR